MATYLVTGGGRGLGLELVRQLSSDATKVSTVFALTRGSPSEELDKIIHASSGKVVHLSAQVTDQASCDAAALEVKSKLGSRGLDVLVNNVGVMPFNPDGIFSMTAEELNDVFNVNVTSVQRVTSALIPLLRKGQEKKIINISTTLGSIAQAKKYIWGPAPAYKITKAAMNMLSVQYSLTLGPEGFTVVALSPGWLKTDLGSSSADLDVDQGVRAVLDVVHSAGPDKNGKYLNIHVPGWENAPGPNQYDGAEVPW